MNDQIVYQDERGWKYRVIAGLGKNMYKARYHKPDKAENICWYCCKFLPWRRTFAEAQADLDALAARKKWCREQE